MKILHVINSLAAAGAENLVVTLANGQVEKEPVSLFTFISEKDIFSEKLKKEVSFYPHKNPNYFSLKKIWHLHKLIKSHDVIHVHLFPPFYIVAFLSIFHRKKRFVYTEHNTSNKRRKAFFKPLERWVYKRYDHVICISHGAENNLKRWMGHQIETTIIKNVVDFDKAIKEKPVTRESLGLTKDQKVLVMVGRFQAQKDQDTIIKALTELPESFVAVFIGEGERMADVKLLVQKEQVSDRVHFLGIRKDVFSILKTCDYGILSSHWEGFGIVALEYMACNLIAFGTDVEGLREVIHEEACLFSVGDYKRLAKQLLVFEEDPERKASIHAIQQNHKEQFDIHTALQQHFKVYAS